jgi:hypothetical protein
VTPVAATISTAQTLSVSIAVSGNSGTPAGSVVLSSGSYASFAAALTNGSASVTVPAGVLLSGSDTLTAVFTPGSVASSNYTQGSGTATVSVGAAPAAQTVTAVATTYPTAGAPFHAIGTAAGVFVAESGGVEVFQGTPSSGLTLTCEQKLGTSLTSQGGAFAELAMLPNGVDVAGGIESPGAVFYNAQALDSCSATPVVISQGAVSADEGTQAVAVTPDGKYAFVSNEYGIAAGAVTEGNIGVVSLNYDTNGNVTGGALLGQITTSGNAIAGMTMSPDGKRLYVTSEVSKFTGASGAGNPVLNESNCVQQVGGSAQVNGLLSVIDVAKAEAAPNTTAIVATVDAGCSPVRMAETADNGVLWVAARGDNRVLAFSTGMLESNPDKALLGYASTGGTAPVGVALFGGSAELLAVANSNRFGAGPTANLTILSVGYPAAASVVQTVTTGLFPRDVTVVSNDPNTLLLANYDSDSLEVITVH